MSEIPDIIADTFRWLWVQCPIYFAWVGGIFWALLTWKRHPRKSFLVMLVLAAFLVEALAWPIVMQLLIRTTAFGPGPAGGMNDFQNRWMIIQFSQSVINAGLWLLLLLALFVVDRKPGAPRGPDGELLPPDLYPERVARRSRE